jgi:hypothetical protein
VTVLEEILSWSRDRPAWQRDALRRLVEKGDLTEEDVSALTEICKGQFGLADPQPGEPLSAAHLPNSGASVGAVALDSIFHHEGVNALALDQTLKFGPRLTVVYGDNGAGKTGYIRILKSACRARGRENILGNVTSGTAPPTPVVAIRYRVGNEVETREWSGKGEDDFISRVSVFDTQSASVYLREKTDVAFRPFGLDLFDKLVQACKQVRSRLETEQRSLGPSLITGLASQVGARDGHQDAYEKEAKYLYGLLREGWERALEEVLLCKVVERFRPGVQTQQIAKIADITEEDCRLVEVAMTKCSRWLRGHDQAAAARAPVPEPDELKSDIESLDAWVKTINKRRA